jgi:hypothetical protein
MSEFFFIKGIERLSTYQGTWNLPVIHLKFTIKAHCEYQLFEYSKGRKKTEDIKHMKATSYEGYSTSNGYGQAHTQILSMLVSASRLTRSKHTSSP